MKRYFMNIISKTAQISALCDLEISSVGSIIQIGENSIVDSFVKMKFSGGIGDIIIGDDCKINSGTVLYSGHGIRIGNSVLIAANCTFSATNHEFISKHKTITEQRFKPSRGGIIIEDDVWIGANCIVLDGAIIRKGSVIGAGSIVRGEIASYTINVGNPLVKIGERL
ncbi:acyltransferase [Ferruginibacter sp. SUN106]|uniref:acyltransferase n=1 Tax=Ferruginibacter sp. SUN106 TaxID=2978348 RepID=UPI003D36B2A1